MSLDSEERQQLEGLAVHELVFWRRFSLSTMVWGQVELVREPEMAGQLAFTREFAATNPAFELLVLVV